MGVLKVGVQRSAGRRYFPFQEWVYSWGSRSRSGADLSQPVKYDGETAFSLDL
jgi:hypothetical protein